MTIQALRQSWRFHMEGRRQWLAAYRLYRSGRHWPWVAARIAYQLTYRGYPF